MPASSRRANGPTCAAMRRLQTRNPVDLASFYNAPEEVPAKLAAVREAVGRQCANLMPPNFERIGDDDVARLFALYDAEFFRGLLAPAAARSSGRPISFRVSAAMTRAGGKTILYRRRTPDGAVTSYFEIAVGARMLFMTFKPPFRPVTVCGHACADRLDALQRIMEHEIVHLAEWVTFGKSRCASRRFKDLAAKIFGHRGATHDLVTPREHAALRHGIRVGDTVRFAFDGGRLTGRVNRISHRATVLVEDPKGLPYTDGRKYRKFYVPLDRLTSVPASS